MLSFLPEESDTSLDGLQLIRGFLIGDNDVKPGREQLAGLVFLIGTISSSVFGLYLLSTRDPNYWMALIMVPFFLLLPVAIDVDWSRRRRGPN